MKNGTLLQCAAAEFEVFVTMDRNLEFQQNMKSLPVSVLVIEATSNRLEHLRSLVPAILSALAEIAPNGLRKSAALNQRMHTDLYRRACCNLSIDVTRLHARKWEATMALRPTLRAVANNNSCYCA